MLYSILIYDSEAVVEALSDEENAERLQHHIALQDKLRDNGKLRPVARLMPSGTATTLRKGSKDTLVLDGPYAETKEQLVGFYLLEADSLDEALDAAKMLPIDTGVLEVRPIGWYEPGL